MPPPKRPMMAGYQVAPGERPTQSARAFPETFFAVGEVVSVDEEKMCMTVHMRDNLGDLQNITIPQPFAGTSSFMMGFPEKGSLVIMGYQGKEKFPLAYLPNYTHGTENRNVKMLPDTVKTVEKNEYFFRVKKLKQGEIALGSSEGIEMFLGDHFRLDHRSGSTQFELRPDENAFLSAAVNNYVFSSGIWQNSGIVKRNSIDPAVLADYPNAVIEHYLNSRSGYALKPGGSDDTVDPYYTEYLLEVEDKGYAQIPDNDVIGDSNGKARRPIALFAMGNFVGNNTSDAATYGKLLRPVLFTDPSDDVGTFFLEPVAPGDADTLGLALAWFKPDRADPSTGAFFGVDKEGHFFQYIPSTTGGGLGDGRSMSILAKGSKKEVWGGLDNSWDLKTTGGIVWKIGRHNQTDGNEHKGRSIDIRTTGAVYSQYGTDLPAEVMDYSDNTKVVADPQNYWQVEKISGKERHETLNDRETIIGGSDKVDIKGGHSIHIVGSRTVSVEGGLNHIVGDAFTEKVTKEKQEIIGNRKTTITSGSSELTIAGTGSLQGSIKETFKKPGSKTTTVILGDIKESVTTQGGRFFSTKAGNYGVNITSGSMKMLTKTGQVSMKTKVGSMDMGASSQIKIATAIASKVSLVGGSLEIKGKTGVLNNVISSGTHQDYITGAYLKGSSTVKVTL